MNSELERIEQYIDSRQSDALALMKRLIEIPGSGREPEDVWTFAPHLQALFEEIGFDCRLIDVGNGNGPTLVGVLGSDRPGKPILFTGHMDTALTKKMAEDNPFHIEDGKMFGSGVLDMRGGIVIAYLTICALQSVGYEKHPIKIIFSGDEEINHLGSQGAKVMLEEAKGGLCAFNMETGLISNQLCIGRKGGVRRKVIVEGVTAHSGNDFTKGRSAIVEMAHKILAIDSLTDLSVGTTMNIGTIEGGTIFNAVPAHCACIVDMRFESNTELEKALRAFDEACAHTYIEGTRTSIEEIDRMDVFETTDAGLRLFDLVWDAYNEFDIYANSEKGPGENTESAKPGKIYLGGSSDAAYITMAGVPTLCSCGTQGEWNHTTKEYALVSSLRTRPLLLAAAILKIGEHDEI